MCLILFSWKTHPKYKLIVAANRDEFYARPTAPANYWHDAPSILAGRDLQAGGTWLGVEQRGRFAAVTNYRDMATIKENAISRGDLTKNFLMTKDSPETYLKGIATERYLYNGFNLLVGDMERLFYYSNIEDEVKILDKGIYGLSNHLLNTPWPKVETGKAQFAQISRKEDFSPDQLFSLLRDVDQPVEGRLPSTGLSMEWERALSSIFIETEEYGTYSSTVLLVDYQNNCSFEERTFGQKGNPESSKYNLRF